LESGSDNLKLIKFLFTPTPKLNKPLGGQKVLIYFSLGVGARKFAFYAFLSGVRLTPFLYIIAYIIAKKYINFYKYILWITK